MSNFIWMCLLKPIWSFVINLIYWIFHIFSLSKTLATKKELKNTTRTLANVKDVMKKFSWTKDNFKDWNAWVITIINKDYKDDCDGAAILAIWLLNTINIESEMVLLYGSSCHAICVSKDRTKMFSNKLYKTLTPEKWKEQVLEFHGGAYNKIVY